MDDAPASARASSGRQRLGPLGARDRVSDVRTLGAGVVHLAVAGACIVAWRVGAWWLCPVLWCVIAWLDHAALTEPLACASRMTPASDALITAVGPPD